MLIPQKTLEEIRRGRVKVVFRRWSTPRIKSGSTIHTSVGLLLVVAMVRCELGDITEQDAESAGHTSRRELLDTLVERSGDVYRIEVQYAGPDPRVSLRNDVELDEEQLDKLRKTLSRMDQMSREGAWTLRILKTIARYPKSSAAELSKAIGWERNRLKSNVRKLKNLGLTVSHHPGYELSPRGRVFLRLLEKRDTTWTHCESNDTETV